MMSQLDVLQRCRWDDIWPAMSQSISQLPMLYIYCCVRLALLKVCGVPYYDSVWNCKFSLAIDACLILWPSGELTTCCLIGQAPPTGTVQSTVVVTWNLVAKCTVPCRHASMCTTLSQEKLTLQPYASMAMICYAHLLSKSTTALAATCVTISYLSYIYTIREENLESLPVITASI